jgi:hypothetical protein
MIVGVGIMTCSLGGAGPLTIPIMGQIERPTRDSLLKECDQLYMKRHRWQEEGPEGGLWFLALCAFPSHLGVNTQNLGSMPGDSDFWFWE